MMTLRRVGLPPSVSGPLWLSAMPGRLEPFEASLRDMQAEGVALLVCLTPRAEMERLAPSYASAVAADRLGCRWLHLPMENFGLPADLAAFTLGIETIAAALGAGDAVLLHCAAGIGRTGSAAACVLKRLGLPTAEALERVRHAGSNPETAVQSGLVQRF